MATEAPEQAAAASDQSSRRIRPHHVVIGFGVGVGLFTVGSGLLPLITEWHDDTGAARGLRQHPERAEAGLLHVFPILILYGRGAVRQRVRNWERGAPDRPRDHAEERRSAG